MTRLVTDNAGILDTIFTGREQRYCLGKRRCYEHLAARFAAKEAILKAFGTGLGSRMRWTEVEIVNGLSGRPRVVLYGEVAAWARRRAVADVDVSLSHAAGIAIAQALVVWGVPDASGSETWVPRSDRFEFARTGSEPETG